MTSEKVKYWHDESLYGVDMMVATLSQHNYGTHIHDQFVIAATERGASNFNSRGISDFAHQSRVLVFNPDEAHSGNMNYSECWHYRAFYLDWKLVQLVCEDIGLDPKDFPYFLNNVIESESLSKKVSAIHCNLETLNDSLLKKILFVEIITELIQYSIQGKYHSNMRLKCYWDARLKYAQSFIKENSAKQITVSDISRASGLPAHSLRRKFKKKFGLNIKEYLIQCRLDNARSLIKNGESLVNASLLSGFYDQSKLTKYFSRAYFYTPKVYNNSFN